MNVRDDGGELKDTSRSDVSQNTNMKVFNGYGGDNVISQLNNQHVKSPSSPKNKNYKTSSKQVFSVLRSLPLNQDTGVIKNPLIDMISFGNGHIFQNNLNNQNKDFVTNTNVEEEKDKESSNSKHSKTSKTSKNSYNSRRSLSMNDPLENMNQFITTEGIVGNDDNDHDPLSKQTSSPHDNLFSKFQRTIEDQDTKTQLFDNTSLTNKNFCNIPDRIIDSFTVSAIEKGVALLVSNDDCIFTLPTFLMPKGVKVGNVYTFSIEEEETKEESENYITECQKKYIEGHSSKLFNIKGIEQSKL